MIEISPVLQIIAVLSVLFFFSRKILDLALGLCVSLFSITITVLGFAIASFILTVVAFPVGLVVCQVAEHNNKYMTPMLHDICTPRPKTPKLVSTTHKHITQAPVSSGKY